VLYVPASNARALEKAAGLDCDAVILDLEDAVAPEAKAAARTAAVAAAEMGFGGRLVAVRCNALDTEWGADDMAAMAAAGPDAVLVPKVRTPEDIRAWDEGLGAAPTRLWAMVETCEGVLGLPAIAAAGRRMRLQLLAFGSNDLASEMGLRAGFEDEALAPVKTQMVLAARAHGLIALGGVFTGIGDEAGFAAECRQDAGFGMDGKTLIHPSQIAPANLAFSPSPEELAWAEAVVAAFAAPEATGKGALLLNGRMVERLHLAQAERVLGRRR
jgi:citrate lyase subunit beta/citryl-CoA lyase